MPYILENTDKFLESILEAQPKQGLTVLSAGLSVILKLLGNCSVFLLGEKGHISAFRAFTAQWGD